MEGRGWGHGLGLGLGPTLHPGGLAPFPQCARPLLGVDALSSHSLPTDGQLSLASSFRASVQPEKEPLCSASSPEAPRPSLAWLGHRPGQRAGHWARGHLEGTTVADTPAPASAHHWVMVQGSPHRQAGVCQGHTAGQTRSPCPLTSQDSCGGQLQRWSAVCRQPSHLAGGAPPTRAVPKPLQVSPGHRAPQTHTGELAQTPS